MMRDEPWQRGEIPGPIKAIVLRDSKVIASLLKKARRPILVIGYMVERFSKEGVDIYEFIVQLSKLIDLHVVATGRHVNVLRERGVESVVLIPAMELLDRISDPQWSGLDGRGQYDLLILMGFPYYYEWLMLSRLKHYAYSYLKTLTLDPYYHPNATYTLVNLPIGAWSKLLNSVIEHLMGR